MIFVNIELLLHLLLVSVEIALAIPMLYLVILSIAALSYRTREGISASKPATHFALLIPAHNEEAVLGALLANLRKLEYPSHLMDVYVVADNCTDATAALAREAKALVYERHNTREQGKGYALRWLLEQLEAAGCEYDAYVVIDADSVVSANFLHVMDAQLQAGHVIIQSQYRVQNGEAAWTAGLRAIAFALFNHLRPLGRSVLGWSSGLKGTGMCFSGAVVKQFSWTSFSLTEDIEHHVMLLKAGLRIAYAPAAIVWSAMPTSLKQSQSQQMRWERGRLDLVRRYVAPLIWRAICTRNTALFDAAMEILVPPLSVLAGLVVCCGAGALWLHALLEIDLGLALVIGLSIYVLIGLRLARLSRAAYYSLLFAPAYIAWKLWIYGVALVSAGDRKWVRTSR